MDHIDRVIYCLPEMHKRTFSDFFSSSVDRKKVTELRLRVAMPSSVTYGDRNISVFGGKEIILTQEEMLSVVSRLCEESVHTYSSTINEGYITLSDGLRVGVCGKARCEGGKILSVREITSVCVRIPHSIYGVASDILPLILQKQRVYSTLIYSLPGVGKTTVLRDLAARLSQKKRVAVVDSRGEIYIREMFAHSLCDFLDGYPKGVGIELATRTLSPEAIICDEIGDDDTVGILAAQNTGVPLIATAHGENFSEILMRTGIRKLCDAGIFRFYIGLCREAGCEKFTFDIKDARRMRV